MLKVICNQRDRFRTRLREAEEVCNFTTDKLKLYTLFFELFLIYSYHIYQQVRQLKEKIGMLTVELENTKADNVKLYGKIRYVQDYSLEKLSSRGPKKVLVTFS